MMTTNIDVTDGLRNGAVGTVTNVVIDQTTGEISVILGAFDSEYVGQEARYTKCLSQYKPKCCSDTLNTGYISCTEKSIISSSQFPLTLTWAVTVHKCQGPTLPEIVIDMTCAKGKFKPGEAYVASSRVRKLGKLHIINYT